MYILQTLTNWALRQAKPNTGDVRWADTSHAAKQKSDPSYRDEDGWKFRLTGSFHQVTSQNFMDSSMPSSEMVLQGERKEFKHPVAPNYETAAIWHSMPHALMAKWSLHSWMRWPQIKKNHLQGVRCENSHEPKFYYYHWQRANTVTKPLLMIIMALHWVTAVVWITGNTLRNRKRCICVHEDYFWMPGLIQYMAMGKNTFLLL